MAKPALILNGSNLNGLGTREPLGLDPDKAALTIDLDHSIGPDHNYV